MPRRGASPSTASVAAARSFGVDLSGHRSSALLPAELEQADALILLDSDAEWRLRQMCPDYSAETVILAGPNGAGNEVFPAIAAALDRLANVVDQSFRSVPPSPALGAAVPARQAA
jgi:protein-tyrosine-phosphatase